MHLDSVVTIYGSKQISNHARYVSTSCVCAIRCMHKLCTSKYKRLGSWLQSNLHMVKLSSFQSENGLKWTNNHLSYVSTNYAYAIKHMYGLCDLKYKRLGYWLQSNPWMVKLNSLLGIGPSSLWTRVWARPTNAQQLIKPIEPSLYSGIFFSLPRIK